MALPAAYTEATLATFMHYEAAGAATNLEWINPDSYAEIINDALALGGVSDVSEWLASEARIYARVALWRRAIVCLGEDLDMTVDGLSLSGSPRKHAEACLAQAESDLADLTHVLVNVIERTSMQSLEDPFDNPFIDPLGRT